MIKGKGGLDRKPKEKNRLYPMRIVLLMLLTALAPSVAQADFRLCNQTSDWISVAIAYNDGVDWISEGWWNIKPAACNSLLQGSLAAEYYYLYAMDVHGGEWKGKTYMCTSTQEFKIRGHKNCFARGYERTGFFEIDTGRNTKTWTTQITASPR